LPQISGANQATDEAERVRELPGERVIPAFVVEGWLFDTKLPFTCAEALIVRKKLAIKAAIINFFIIDTL